MKILAKTIILSLGLLFVSCQNHYKKVLLKKEQSSVSILFEGVNIFNGRDSVLITNKDVLIENGLIKRIADKIEAPEGSNLKRIAAKGKTLMPGLVDAHVHLSGSGAVPWENVSADEEYNLSAYLYAGITTVYDLGGLGSGLEKLANKVEEGKIVGPSLYHAHIPITVKDGHPIPLTEQMLPWPLKSMVNLISPTIEGVEEAPKLIEKYLTNDVDYIKIICDQIPPGSPEMSFDQLKALIDAAHKADKKVFVHIGSPENAITAVKAGADVLAHGIWRGKLTPEQADIIATSKIPVIYTIAGFQNVDYINKGKFMPSKLDKHLVPETVLSPVTGEKGKDVHQQKVMDKFFEDVSNQSANWQENFKLLLERNVPMLVGTDSGLPGTYAGSTYFQEIDALKLWGLSNYDILRGATYLPSKLFLDNPNFGLVKEGKTANLLLIDGNPLENIHLLKTPELILLKGDIIEKVNE